MMRLLLKLGAAVLFVPAIAALVTALLCYVTAMLLARAAQLVIDELFPPGSGGCSGSGTFKDMRYA